MKNWVLWNHDRGTWQYDVFCLMIVAFIFLTPKSWYDRTTRATQDLPAAVQTGQTR